MSPDGPGEVRCASCGSVSALPAARCPACGNELSRKQPSTTASPPAASPPPVIPPRPARDPVRPASPAVPPVAPAATPRRGAGEPPPAPVARASATPAPPPPAPPASAAASAPVPAPPPPPLAPEVSARADGIEKLIAGNPKGRAPYLQLAQLYQGAGRKDLALEVYARYLRQAPGDRYIEERVQFLTGSRPEVTAKVSGPSLADRAEVARERARLRRIAGAVGLVLLAAALVLAARVYVFPPQRPIAVGATSYGEPRWAPDGRRLAYVEQRDDGRRLWIWDRKSGRARDLGAPAGFAHSWGAFVWSPQGVEIAYSGYAVGEDGDGNDEELDEDAWGEQIYVADVTDGKARRVAQGSDPEWSGDGRFLAYVCTPTAEDYRRAGEDGPYPGSGLCVINPLSGEVTRVVDRETGPPSWEPNGNRIVFAMSEERANDEALAQGGVGAGQDGGESIAEDALAGGAKNLIEVNRGMADAVEAQRRRERKEGSSAFGLRSNLFLVAADGSGLRQLTRDGQAADPRWAPDGKSILFRHLGAPRGIHVHRIAPDGGAPAPLAPAVDATHPSQVAISRDGRRIVFRAGVKGIAPGMAEMLVKAEPLDLYLVAAGGARAKRLENRHTFKGAFALSADGRKVAYQAFDKQTGRGEIWILSP